MPTHRLMAENFTAYITDYVFYRLRSVRWVNFKLFFYQQAHNKLRQQLHDI